MTQNEIQNAITITGIDHAEAVAFFAKQFISRNGRYSRINAECNLEEMVIEMGDKPASYFPRDYFVEAAAMQSVMAGSK